MIEERKNEASANNDKSIKKCDKPEARSDLAASLTISNGATPIKTVYTLFRGLGWQSSCE